VAVTQGRVFGNVEGHSFEVPGTKKWKLDWIFAGNLDMLVYIMMFHI